MTNGEWRMENGEWRIVDCKGEGAGEEEGGCDEEECAFSAGGLGMGLGLHGRSFLDRVPNYSMMQ
jgi:hypothetical protein